jgi:hypothetical protein
MSFFQGEVLLVGIKEGIKVSVGLFVVREFLRARDSKLLWRVILLSLAVTFLASFLCYRLPSTQSTAELITKAIGYVFGIFYLLSLVILYHYTGTELLGPLKKMLSTSLVVPLVFFLSIVYFLPDLAGTVVYVKAEVAIKESIYPLLWAVAGFLIGVSTIKPLSRLKISRFLELPQVFLLLALIKLVGGGIKGFAELSLIPSVQKGLMKFIHDIVHQTFVTIMVPDHPLLKVTTWNFIGILFGEKLTLWLSLFILILPLFLFLKRYLSADIHVPETITTGASRRLYIKRIRNERLLRSVPLAVFLLLVLFTWFSERGETISRLYNPEPVPLVVEEEKVIIPIKSPGADLRDGMLHKYSIDIDGEEVRVLIMQKPDGTLAVCLDACEICPPEGYAQGKEHLLCLYCRTPIPLDSLGKPGGCNPIPINALVTDREVQIPLKEIRKAWEAVRTGKTKERIKR